MRWHGGQDTSLKAVAWELEVLSEGMIKCIVVDKEEKEAQEIYGVWGQALYLVRFFFFFFFIFLLFYLTFFK